MEDSQKIRFYRMQASELRRMAAASTSAERQSEFSELARQYEILAARLVRRSGRGSSR